MAVSASDALRVSKTDEPVPRRRRPLVVVSAPFVISVLIHVIVLLALALVFTPQATDRDPVPVMIASWAAAESIEEFVPLEIELADEQEVESPLAEPIVDADDVAIGDVVDDAPDGLAAADQPAGSVGIGTLDGLDLAAGRGGGDDGLGGQAGVTFFGATSKGDTVVFVVDNSNSMTNGRFETAIKELLGSVAALGPRQRFYVIFFSDTAYGMFHPQTAAGMVPATAANKDRLAAWLSTVEMCLQTRGEEAMRKAIALEPDVINILGDGVFTDDTVALVTAAHSRRTVINTFGMQVNRKGEQQLTAIARANGGSFHRVDVDPAAEKAARGRPIPRNRSRGPVWGLRLPAEK